MASNSTWMGLPVAVMCRGFFFFSSVCSIIYANGQWVLNSETAFIFQTSKKKQKTGFVNLNQIWKMCLLSHPSCQSGYYHPSSSMSYDGNRY